MSVLILTPTLTLFFFFNPGILSFLNSPEAWYQLRVPIEYFSERVHDTTGGGLSLAPCLVKESSLLPCAELFRGPINSWPIYRLQLMAEELEMKTEAWALPCHLLGQPGTSMQGYLHLPVALMPTPVPSGLCLLP